MTNWIDPPVAFQTPVPPAAEPPSNPGAALRQAGVAQTPPPVAAVSNGAIDSRALFINRELSWLEFNARVLAEAENAAVPLFERLKFLAIVASNLDEFFMVRVAGLKQQLQGDLADLPPDGASPGEQLAAISARAHELVEGQYRAWNDLVRPALERDGIVLLRPEDLTPAQLELLDKQYRADIFPVLTPISVDPNHPFPHLKNKSLNIGVMFVREHQGVEMSFFGVVQVPEVLRRVMPVPHPTAKHAFVLLEDVIARHAHEIFSAFKLRGCYAFRVTRNWDLEIDEEEGEDLLQTIQQELRRRDRGAAVRVEVSGNISSGSLSRLCRALKVNETEDIYRIPGPLHLADLTALVARDERRDLRDEPWGSHVVPPLRDAEDFFAVLRERDVLLHHPYESFDTVVEFVSRAAEDPHVLAIKQTLYRAGGDSPIVKALARAAENGKQVTAIVELKARFDEESNIRWASTLEKSGVHVVYGVQGLKTHAKACLVARREKDRIRRYVHLSTGNYNQSTARLYTDLALFTSRDVIGEDVTALFNLLTSYSVPQAWKALTVAPLGLAEKIVALIQRETEHAKAGRPARIIAKMNACVDSEVIHALYAAAQAGVDITLLVRGICCLRPSLPGVSERIRVVALIDRFLEHSRVFWFANGGEDDVYLSSADWMPRNFHRRVEVLVPIFDPQIKTRLTNEILNVMLSDNTKSWVLQPDGRYVRVEVKEGEPLVRCQTRFMEASKERVKEAEKLANRVQGRIQIRPKPAATEARDRETRIRKKKRDAGPGSNRWKV
ncbi:MAG: polyphosphate kinase 1 [Polyangiaceae bacterium]